MARRRKKTAKGGSSKKTLPDKALPAIPPPEARHTAYNPDIDLQHDPMLASPMPEAPSVSKTMRELRHDTDSDNSRPPTSQNHQQQPSMTLAPTTYNDHRKSFTSQRSDLSGGAEEFLIPLAFDPNPPKQTPSSQNTPQSRQVDERPRDYFAQNRAHNQTGSISQLSGPHVSHTRQPTNEHLRKQPDIPLTKPAASNNASPPISSDQHHSPHISVHYI